MIDGRLFYLTVRIPMDTNCVMFSPTCSFIRMKQQVSFWNFSRKTKGN